MERRIPLHHGLDQWQIIPVDSILEGIRELSRFDKGIDMSLELGPTREPVRTGDLKLGVGKRYRATRFQQVLGLIL
jgi:hypothetical protein